MNILLFHQPWAYALGMSLLHSLWQISLIYLIYRIVLYILRRGSSFTRYRLALISFGLIPLFMLITFLHYHHSVLPLSSESAQVPFEGIGITGGSESFQSLHVTSSSENPYLPWFLCFYFAGILVLSFRFLFSLFYLNRFRKNSGNDLPAYIVGHLNTLINKLGIRRRLRLIESGIARSPLVMGFWKPLIIVPAGVFTQLPFNQVEAILLHELAHIKRNDYIINIFQTVVEILLFYHPLVYLISRDIRLEREHCCDDLALRHFNSSVNYAKALARMEEFRLNSPYPAVAFAEKGSLITRIKRILKPQTMKTKTTDRFFAGIVILAGLLIMLVSGAAGVNHFSHTSNDPSGLTSLINLSTSEPEPGSAEAMVNDTSLRIDSNRIITTMEDDEGNSHQYEMEFEGGKLIMLNIDGKDIPEKDFPKYKELVEITLEKVREANRSIEKAERKISEIDKEELEKKVQASLKKLDEVEWEKLNEEIKKLQSEEVQARINEKLEKAQAEMQEAMEHFENDSVQQKVQQALAEARQSLDETDWEKMEEDIQRSLQEAKRQMEDIDWEKIQKDVEQSLKDVQADLPEIKIQVQKSLSEIDFDQILNDLEKSRLELQNEKQKLQEMEQEMEKSLPELEEK